MKENSSARGHSRRRFIQTSAGIVGAASLPMFGIGSAWAQQSIKIGVAVAKQGPLAQQGADIVAGMQKAIEDAGHKALGRSIELVWVDESTPQESVQNAGKLIEEQKVIAILGGTTSSTSLAMGAVALRAKVPLISVVGAAREITGKDCNPFMFRLPASVPVYARAMAPQLLALGKRWYFIAGSFAFGEDVINSFSEVLLAAGGVVAGIDRVPVATTDYSSFVLKARAAKPDVLVSGAANVEPILKQLKELGLTGRLPVAGPGVSDTDLWSASQAARTGIFGKPWYFNDPLNGAEERAFVASYTQKEGKPPSDRVFGGWLSVRLVLAAVGQAKSLESVAIAKALNEVRLQDDDSPYGFRASDHQLIRRVVIGTARPNAANKWDTLQVQEKRPSPGELERDFGPPEQFGCKMSAI
jgi:branched-chain amino acid transport system substrate-binding protein